MMNHHQSLPCSFVLLLVLCIASTSRVVDSLSLLPVNNNDGASGSVNRRDVLIGVGSVGISSVVAASTSLAFPQPSWADDTDTDNNKQLPIAVLGASGRTGALCVLACLERGIPVRALTRSGSWVPPESGINLGSSVTDNNPLLSVASCDLKDTAAIQKGVQGCRGVIYAASASKNGGNAKDIDNVGVIEAGKACLDANVGRYVVLSSTATTRPKSMGYIFTNVLGGIMDEKRQGEVGIQELYASSTTTTTSGSSSSYTIIRPGGLEEPKKNEVLGPATLEISQGDTLAGIISRADLAEVAVELAASNAENLRNTAVELYYTDSAQPCERRFKSLLTMGGVRLHGDTYQDLFSGIQPNVDYYQP